MPTKRARRAALWLTDYGLKQTNITIDDLVPAAREQLKDFARRQGMDPESIHAMREYQHTTMPNITVVEASFYGKDDEDK